MDSYDLFGQVLLHIEIGICDFRKLKQHLILHGSIVNIQTNHLLSESLDQWTQQLQNILCVKMRQMFVRITWWKLVFFATNNICWIWRI